MPVWVSFHRGNTVDVWAEMAGREASRRSRKQKVMWRSARFQLRVFSLRLSHVSYARTWYSALVH